MQWRLHRATFLRLLGFVTLFSTCSSRLLGTVIKQPLDETGGFSSNLSGLQGSGSGEEGSSDSPLPSDGHSGQYPMLPPRFPGLPGGNIAEEIEHGVFKPINTRSFHDHSSELCDTLLNSQVSPTADQVPVPCVCSLCKNTMGPKGEQGGRGPPGSPGSAGRRGLVGLKGQQGLTGQPGIKGQKGERGEKGKPGNAGVMGLTGQGGWKGENGAVGLFGPPGPQGPTGGTGTCPSSCTNALGSPGSEGPPGPAGVRGLPGVQGSVGPQGMRGEKGDLGTTGEPGVVGGKGDRGDQGTCECTDGVNGTDGDPGEMGFKGNKGDAGDFGVQGSTGLQGHQGDMGLMGPPGPCTPAIQSAFTATLNESFPLKNAPVTFNHVLTNRQGHFNPYRGIYTAPINGTYVFSFHLSVAFKPLKVGFFMNFIPLVKTTATNQPTVISHEIVYHLNTGDRVWLQVKDEQTNGMFTDNEQTSTFSGFLLFPDTCELPFGRHSVHGQPFPDTGFGWDGYNSSTSNGGTSP